jgi:hypothetical protein
LNGMKNALSKRQVLLGQFHRALNERQTGGHWFAALPGHLHLRPAQRLDGLSDVRFLCRRIHQNAPARIPLRREEDEAVVTGEIAATPTGFARS